MATNKDDSFDYNLFIEKLYGVAKNMKDGTDSISDMETVYTLIDGLVEHALVPAIEENDFSMPAEFEVIHRIFSYVYSSLKTPRENLIFFWSVKALCLECTETFLQKAITAMSQIGG